MVANNESISSTGNKLPPAKYSARANAAMTSRALLPKMLSKKTHEAPNNGSILNESQKNLRDRIERQE